MFDQMGSKIYDTLMSLLHGGTVPDDEKIFGVSTVVYTQEKPKALWAQQWPDVWVDGVKKTIRNVVEKSRVAEEEIAGICISGLYGGSGIPLDEHMKPVYPCLIWMDRRARQESRFVEERIGNQGLFEETWNGHDPYYGYTKILWIKNHEQDMWKKIHMFLPPNAYAIYCLTGEVAIDFSSAGNLGGIFSMEQRCWSIPGKAEILRDGKDAAVIAVGVMVEAALQAADILDKEGISVGVVNLRGVKPIDSETLISVAKEPGAIVTAEDHNVYGGVYSAVCEVLASHYPVPVFPVALMDTFAESGKGELLLRKYGLSFEEIVKKIKCVIKEKDRKR